MLQYISLGLEQKVFVRAEAIGEEIHFQEADGTLHRLLHYQDCCECVSIESIVGDLSDLVGAPITLCEEATQDDPDASECGMWTFYKFATVKGYVDVRWYGSSNGYYSVGVSLHTSKEEVE